MTHPAPGQRWTSKREPELGLGLVIEADVSRVRLLFPATGEMRIYAWGNAPLSRYQVPVGDRVCDQAGACWTVESISEQEGCLVYHGEGRSLPESGLADRMVANGPQERLLLGSQDEPLEAFDFRLRVLKKMQEWAAHACTGFLGGRIDWLPHQLSVVREVCSRIHPRVLLADEVGLGKTIEAGLVGHHGVVTGRVRRVLILVPDALVHQWFVEMLRRFHLNFMIADEARFSQPDGDNPFFDAQLVLCSLDFLCRHPDAQGLAREGEWDLLIVDEAHHLAWSPEEASAEYAAVAELAEQVPGVLLLTATPLQMGEATHFAQLRLLDPDRYSSLDAFLEEQQGYVKVAEEAAALREQGDLEALRHLLLCHGPGRIYFRHTREQVAGFPKRIPHPVEIKGTKLEWFQDFLLQYPDEKILVMTRTPAQVKELSEQLQGCLEPPPVLFHEQQHLLERDRQAAWFAAPEGARVMIASDIGGEGRNFQFVRHLVLWDLPRDTDRIEQRIGRLDRIGQQSEFHIHLPVMAGSVEADWCRWVHEGLGALSRPVACAKRCEQIFHDRLDRVDEEILQETRSMVARLEEENRSGVRRLLAWKHELEHPDPGFLAELRTRDADMDLLGFAAELWQVLGLDVEQLREGEYLLKAGALDQGVLRLREEGCRFTPNRQLALAREDLDLMTQDHPLLRDAAEALVHSPYGSSGFARSPETDTPLLQAIFMLEAAAPPQWQAGRYLPPTPIEVTVNTVGDVVAVPADLQAAGDVGALLENPAFRNDWLPDRVEEAREVAVRLAMGILEKALAGMQVQMQEEMRRLEDLREVNDHVRESEVQLLRQKEADLGRALSQAVPRLDALRVILP